MTVFVKIKNFSEVYDNLRKNYNDSEPVTPGGFYRVNGKRFLVYPERESFAFLGSDSPEDLENFVEENLRPKN